MENQPELTYMVTQRLRLIDILLQTQGSVRRETLTEYFGISTPQASTDFQRYIAIAPGNMKYDLSARTYMRADGFKRVWP